MICRYRIPELELDLKKRNWGERIDNGAEEFEQRYTEGALRTIYAILQRDSGAGADLNKNGLIDTPEEANQMPCTTLQKIEELWREYTEDRCGWIGEKKPYDPNQGKAYFFDDADCVELAKSEISQSNLVENTLTNLVFIDVNAEVMNRIGTCLSP